MSRGLFLVLEGVEGAGKSTQASLLSEWLTDRGVPHRLSREPGGTAVGEAIRRVLLDGRGPGMSAEAELLLMLAARSEFVRTVVRPALESGTLMIADRFDLSTLTYQGVGRELGVDEVRRLNRFATGDIRPDVTFVLDVPAATGQARQRSQGKKHDRIEGEGLAFLDKVREAYRVLAQADPRAVLVDASLPAEEVQQGIRKTLAERFPEPFAAGRG